MQNVLSPVQNTLNERTGCPKCSGVLYEESDIYGIYQCCLMCGYHRDIPKKQEGKTMAAADVESSKNVTVECPYCFYIDTVEMVAMHKDQAHPPRRPPLVKLTEPEKAELLKTGVNAFADRHGYGKENRSILWQAYYRHNGSKSNDHNTKKNNNHHKIKSIEESAKPVTYLRSVIEVYENIPLILSHLNSITELVKTGRVEISMSYGED
jgi:hypothetical protein